MRAHDFMILSICAGLLAGLAGAACGVKGPPLPPLSSTPQQSEMRASPRPSPSVTGATS